MYPNLDLFGKFVQPVAVQLAAQHKPSDTAFDPCPWLRFFATSNAERSWTNPYSNPRTASVATTLVDLQMPAIQSAVVLADQSPAQRVSDLSFIFLGIEVAKDFVDRRDSKKQ